MAMKNSKENSQQEWAYLNLKQLQHGTSSRAAYVATGLKIHMGRKSCLMKGQQGTCINTYFLRSKLSQSTEVQQQDKKHNLQNIKILSQWRKN